MALVRCLFLSLLILLTVLHPGAANYVPLKSQEADASLAESLAAWQKYGLEPLGEPEEYAKADELWKSSVIKQMHNYKEMAGETTKEVPNGQRDIGSVFCRGAGCMIVIITAPLVVLAILMISSLASYCWYKRKRRFSGDQEERVGLITAADRQDSSP